MTLSKEQIEARIQVYMGILAFIDCEEWEAYSELELEQSKCVALSIEKQLCLFEKKHRCKGNI